MRWFKHMTDALDDPFINDLMDKFGHMGYVGFFGLIEIIAKENGNILTGKLSVSPTFLRRKLRSSPRKLRQLFEYCQREGRLSFTFSEKLWHFDFPKILELKDNYTKNLQVTRNKLSNHKEVEVEVEVEVEEDIKKTAPSSQNTSSEPTPKKVSFEAYKNRIKIELPVAFEKNLPVYRDLFPDVDHGRQYKLARDWLLDNPRRQRKNFHQFLKNWFEKEQKRINSRNRQQTQEDNEWKQYVEKLKSEGKRNDAD